MKLRFGGLNRLLTHYYFKKEMQEMTPGKRLRIFIVALFAIFAGLSNCCYGDPNCGFGSTCPYVKPPCYKVTFSGLMECNDVDPLLDVNTCNSTFVLPYGYDSYGYYYPSPDNCTYIGETFCMWYDWFWFYGPGTEFEVSISHSGDTTMVNMDCDGGWPYFEYVGDFAPSGSGTNWLQECHCDPNIYCSGFDADLYGGTATWEPIWDCNDCNNCDELTITVSDYNDLHYGNKDCCPPGKGDVMPLKFSCNDADYVIPTYTIEVDPNDSGTWLEVDSSELVTVTPDPNQCAERTRVTFTIEAGQGCPPAKARVTCTAAFFTDTGDTKSKTVTVYVEPSCDTCCDPPLKCPVPIL